MLLVASLKLKHSRCKSFRRQTNYLGHVVISEEVSMDLKKIQAVVEWPRQTIVTEVISFLGISSYFRRFIPIFKSCQNI